MRAIHGKADGAAGGGAPVSPAPAVAAAENAERRFRDLEQPVLTVAFHVQALGQGFPLSPRAGGHVGVGEGDVPGGMVDEGERELRVPEPHRQRHGVEQRRQVPVLQPGRVDRRNPDPGPGGAGAGHVAHPNHVGQDVAAIGFGARPDRLNPPPPGGQQHIERRTFSAQQRHALLKSLQGIVFEASADVVISRLNAVGKVKQHRQAPGAREAAVDMIPEEQAVGRRGQHFARLHGDRFQPPAFVFYFVQAAPLVQDDEKRHQCGQGDAGGEGLERINFGKHRNRLNGRPAPHKRGGGKGRGN